MTAVRLLPPRRDAFSSPSVESCGSHQTHRASVVCSAGADVGPYVLWRVRKDGTRRPVLSGELGNIDLSLPELRGACERLTGDPALRWVVEADLAALSVTNRDGRQVFAVHF